MIAEIQQERDKDAQALRQRQDRLAEILSNLGGIPALVDEIAALIVRVAHFDAMLATLGQPPVESRKEPRPKPIRKPDATRAKARPLPVPDITKGVAGIIVRALEKAGPTGLSGGELNRVVQEARHSVDAAEKTKAKLKTHGLVIHNKLAQRWYAITKDDEAEVSAGLDQIQSSGPKRTK